MCIYYRKDKFMKSQILIKNISRFIVSELIFIAYTMGIFRDILLIANLVFWAAMTIYDLKRCPSEDDEIEPEPDSATTWYCFYGRKLLCDLITDLNTQGTKRLEIDESGEIRIGEDKIEQISLFPNKSAWNSLIEELANDGLCASVNGDKLVITW